MHIRSIRQQQFDDFDAASGDMLSKTMPITTGVIAAATVAGRSQYDTFLAVYELMKDLKDRLPDSYLNILKSLGVDYNSPGNLSHRDYCNR